jgi:hypothetical protein
VSAPAVATAGALRAAIKHPSMRPAAWQPGALLYLSRSFRPTMRGIRRQPVSEGPFEAPSPLSN